jgi:hypothetical protein
VCLRRCLSSSTPRRCLVAVFSLQAESHTLAAQLSQRGCDSAACEHYCKAALEIAPRLPTRNGKWVEMLAVGTRGDAFLTRGDWQGALGHYHTALGIAKSLGESLAAAAAELQLAEVERRRHAHSGDIASSRGRAMAAGKIAARSGTGALRTVAAALRTPQSETSQFSYSHAHTPLAECSFVGTETAQRFIST